MISACRRGLAIPFVLVPVQATCYIRLWETNCGLVISHFAFTLPESASTLACLPSDNYLDPVSRRTKDGQTTLSRYM